MRNIFRGLKSVVGGGRNSGSPDDYGALRDIENHAVKIAREAGEILRWHFERALNVEYKDDKKSDPVTNADYECQRYLQNEIAKRFPDHGILGEEDDANARERADSQPAPDFVWVLDPLDGTRNFLSGLPIYASSIGVLYRGAPIAAAVFMPWPSDVGSIVMHARKGGGTRIDGTRVPALTADAPDGNRLVTLPGGFGALFDVRKQLRGKVGELRMTGSIAYELAMVAKGVTQYTITTAPFLWDAAGGSLLVMEAGGIVLQGGRRKLLGRLPIALSWQPLESFAPSWTSGTTTMKELREWRAPLLLGSPSIARYVAANLRGKTDIKRQIRRRLSRGRK
ncbi:MAG: inositol monophosphatase [Chloroflexi bacterium]|nr:inositol monophosphatase [Chloroflexota bacterium]